jgi:hypothetical protein
VNLDDLTPMSIQEQIQRDAVLKEVWLSAHDAEELSGFVTLYINQAATSYYETVKLRCHGRPPFTIAAKKSASPAL